MFAVAAPPQQHWLRSHFDGILQARPVDLAISGLPGKQPHLRSLCNALKRAHRRIYSTRTAIYSEDSQWVLIEDDVASDLADAVIGLECVLDGFVMLDQDQPTLDSSMAFRRTGLKDANMRMLQEDIRALKSSEIQGSGANADLWTLADFWKHYMPYQPRPSTFSGQQIRDYKVNLGDNGSGPILHDLIIPAYNKAADIAALFVRQLSTPTSDCPPHL